MTAVKLAGFLVLLAVIFAWAHVVGGTVGTVTTRNSQAGYAGGGAAPGDTNMGGMNMGGHP